MKRLLLTSAIGCFSLLWCLGCETGEYLEGDADLLDDADEDLSSKAASVGLFQAEKFTAQSGCSIATNKAGYTGTGFMDYGGNGTWIELNNVNVAQAGSYTLKFRYATASGSRQCAVLINGANVGNVAFSSTGSWTTWGTASLTKSLKAGSNTIRILANTSSGGPNLDSMEVLSEIVATGSCVEAAENKTAALSCPAGQTIASVSFASYGLPTGACPGGFATSSCHAASSLDKVKAACLNKPSCSVAASNGVFGDPCSGKPKKLAVVYSCSGGGPIDNCPSDPNKTEPGQCGCGVPEGTCNQTGAISHVGTTQVWDSNGQDLSIGRPSGSKAGDLLILALHRTDDDLPLYVNGWTRVAECYKRDNGYQCSTEDDCTSWHNDDFCGTFGSTGQGGHDLAQSIFYRVVGASEPSSYKFNLNTDTSGHPGWAILTALRGAATSNPVRDWDNKGCDGDADSLFPSVYGQKGDMVLLSQSFDDAIAKANFGAPNGTSTFGYVSNSDEAGFLFGGILNSTGETGVMRTNGAGASACKDALVSLTIKPK